MRFALPTRLPENPRLLHVFDMDGTLLRDAAILDLARHFRCEEVGIDLERRYLAGAVTDREFWTTLLEICGSPSDDQLDAAFRGAAWRTGVEETFSDIRGRGDVAVVISQSPEFFVQRLTKWGAHAGYGSMVRFGVPVPDDATLEPIEKVQITDAILRRLGMSKERCVAYGDSASDRALFEWLPNSVGINAKSAVVDLVSAQYRGDDIHEAYLLGRALVDEPRDRAINDAARRFAP